MYADLSTLMKIKPRILFVENDPAARVSYQALLMEWGYEPVLAMGRGNALRDHACAQAREKRCSLALIDLRLMDNDDETDISGLTLAKDLRADHPLIVPIILSGYESVQVLRILKDRPDIPFIGKQDRRSDIQEKLDKVAAQICAAKRNIEFLQTDVLADFMQSEFVGGMEGYQDQIINVLACMFPEAKTLRFERLLTSKDAVSSVARPNSIVLKVFEDGLEACVVKLARVEKIKKEAANFRKYILRKLTGNFNPQQIGKEALSWEIGGIAYTFEGGKNARTFTSYHKEQNLTNIRDVLSCFFLETWGKYYKPSGGKYDTPPTEIQGTSLYALYSKTWGEDWYKKCAKEISAQTLRQIEPTLQKYNLPQPIEWIRQKLSNGNLEFSPVNSILSAVTHGDLHGDNLLVDDRKNIWVVDFERCGEGHALQDFIELEADIVNRLHGYDIIQPSYFKMCLNLLSQVTISELGEADTVSADAQIDKALKTISVIRKLAAECFSKINPREYLLGLMFNMLFRAFLVHKDDPQKSERSLVLAALICHRLDHWGDA
ncbi:MAG: phosphotransferase [Anaerolineales bacterium]|nr:phosphotransferase [Anaerolineales bacterium]